MRKWKRIIVHHSASDWGNAITINKWHSQRDGWNGIGYHFVITNGILTPSDLRSGRIFVPMIGSIECGRQLDGDNWVDASEIGAHALGLNHNSIGVCLIHKIKGYDDRTIDALVKLVMYLRERHNIKVENILGHCEADAKKPLCPGLNMGLVREAVETGGFIRDMDAIRRLPNDAE